MAAQPCTGVAMLCLVSVQSPSQVKVSKDTFISREITTFLFSVVRMVRCETKTPKIIGCYRANFAFLQATVQPLPKVKWTFNGF